MLHVSALFEPSSRHKLQEILFFSFVLQFLSYCIGDPFCITNHNYCLYGVRCPLLVVIGGGVYYYYYFLLFFIYYYFYFYY